MESTRHPAIAFSRRAAAALIALAALASCASLGGPIVSEAAAGPSAAALPPVASTVPAGLARVVVADDSAFAVSAVEIDGRAAAWTSLAAGASADLLVPAGARALRARLDVNGRAVWTEQAGDFADGGTYRWSVTAADWEPAAGGGAYGYLDPYDYLKPQPALEAQPDGLILGPRLSAERRADGLWLRVGDGEYGPFEGAGGAAVRPDGRSWGVLAKRADGWYVVLDGKDAAGPYQGECRDFTFAGWEWVNDLQSEGWALKRYAEGKQWLVVDGREYGPYADIQQLLLGPSAGRFIAAVRSPGAKSETLLADGAPVGDYDDVFTWDCGRSAAAARWALPARRGDAMFAVISGKEYGPFASVDGWAARRSGGRLVPVNERGGRTSVFVDGQKFGPFNWVDTNSAQTAGAAVVCKVGMDGGEGLIAGGKLYGPFDWIDENSLWAAPAGTDFLARANTPEGPVLIRAGVVSSPFSELEAKRVAGGAGWVVFERRSDGAARLYGPQGDYPCSGVASVSLRPDNLDHWAASLWSYRNGALVQTVVVDGRAFAGRDLRFLRIAGKPYFSWFDDRTFNVRTHFLALD